MAMLHVRCLLLLMIPGYQMFVIGGDNNYSLRDKVLLHFSFLRDDFAGDDKSRQFFEIARFFQLLLSLPQRHSSRYYHTYTISKIIDHRFLSRTDVLYLSV